MKSSKILARTLVNKFNTAPKADKTRLFNDAAKRLSESDFQFFVELTARKPQEEKSSKSKNKQ